MTKVKVLHTIKDFNIGGTEMLLLELFKLYSSNDFELCLFYSGKGSQVKYLNNLGIKVFIEMNKFLPLYVYKLRRLVKNQKISIIHSHQLVESIFFKIATFKMKTKHILTFHGHKYFTKNLFIKNIGLLFSNKLDARIFVSGALLQFYQTNYRIKKNNNFILYNFLLPSRLYSGNMNSTHNSKIIHKHKDSIFIGMIGNFSPGRDHLTVCKALKIIKEEGIDFQFVFIGGYQSNFYQYYKECLNFCELNNMMQEVNFLGFREDVSDLLAMMDIYVYSSNSDSFGLSIIEAISYAIPTIINDIDSLLEVTDKGKRAIVFKTKDNIDLAKKIKETIINLSKMKEQFQSHKMWVRSTYSFDKYSLSINKIYSTILN